MQAKRRRLLSLAESISIADPSQRADMRLGKRAMCMMSTWSFAGRQ